MQSLTSLFEPHDNMGILLVGPSTQPHPDVSLQGCGRWSGFMAYEWDMRKARKAFLIKSAAAWIVAIAVATVPLILALNTIGF